MANLFDGNDLKIVQELKTELRELKEVFTDLSKQIKNTQTSFNQQSTTQDDLKKKTKQLTDVDKELEKIEKRSEKTTKEVIKAQLELTKKRKDLREEVLKENESLKTNNSFTQKLTKSFQNAVLKVTAFIAVAKGVYDVLKKVTQNTIELNKQTSKTAATFDIERKESEKLTKEIRKLSAAYGQEFNEILKTSNILAKEFGITGNEALELINQGFEKGANINGEFLGLLKEYPAQLKTVGLNAKQTIAIITQTERAGVFSDKGIDAIKEAGIRLREMTPATQAALNAIGLSSTEIQQSLTDGSKTLFEVTQEVSGQLSKLPPQSKEVGTAIADIFGGPGEDVGLRFLSTIKDIDTDLGNIETSLGDVEQSQIKLNKAWQDFQDSLISGDGVLAKLISKGLGELTQVLNTLIVLTKGVAQSVQDDLVVKFDNYANKIEEVKGKEEALIEIMRLKQLQSDKIIELESKLEGANKRKTKQIEKEIEQRQQVIAAQDITIQRLNDEINAKEQLTESTKTLTAEEIKALEIAKEKEKQAKLISGLNVDLQSKEVETIKGGFDAKKELEQGYTDYLSEQEDQRTIKKEEEEAKRAAIEEANRELKKASEEAAIQIATDQYAAFIDNRLNSYQEENQREQDILKNRLDKGFITEKQYNDSVKKLQIKQRQEEARATKKKALFDIFINGLVAFTNALRTGEPPFNLISAGLVAGLAALQAAAVAAEPIPKFGYGSGVLSKDTLAQVGDRYQHEAILMPSGQVMFSDNKPQNVLLPSGSQVLSGEQTKEFVQDRGLNDVLLRKMIISLDTQTKLMKKQTVRTKDNLGYKEKGRNYVNRYIGKRWDS